MKYVISLLSLAVAFSYTHAVFAAENETDESAIDDEVIEEVVVTGSRIKRDEYSSASPIQIIDGQGARELGLIDTASLLQSATQATGTQIDNTFTAFVLDNGPGAAQVNLRGLGAQRVLLLLNSKRVAPGGVGGAPTSPDISTIPNIMIDRIEYLLDGASSIYGSDAVAGVANVIMRTDFDGIDFEGQIVNTDATGGDEKTLGIAWGKTGDNWTLGIAGEYYGRDRLRLSGRSFTSQCNRYIHEDENGNELNNRLDLVPGTTISPCKLVTRNRIFIATGWGNIWSTPGTTNIGIPNFSETEVPIGFTGFNPAAIIPTDIDGDGIPDIGLVDPDGNGESEVDLQTDQYNFNGAERNRAGDLLFGSERTNIYAYGEYDLGNESNSTLYFESLFARRTTEVYSPGPSVFPDVPPNNPYNPCNQFAPGGVNCLGFFGFNFGNFEVTPIVEIRGDRDNNDVEIEQSRIVGGIRSDLPGWRNDSGFGNWSYDLYYSYSRSVGVDKQFGILEEPFLRSINTSRFDPETGQVVCGNGEHCVPINMFAESIYQPGGGDFATQEERDFVFGVRSFDTEVIQSIFSGVLQGDVFEIPWNDTTIPLVFGFEYREDEINSIPNAVARDGSFYGYFSDRGAVGKRDITELFAETELQLMQDLPFAREWSINLSSRWTEESTYGSDTTYSVKSVFTPVDSLTLRGTYGTSFRAPNAREQFLLGTSGFVTVADPCVVPIAARIPSLNPNEPATYDPEEDQREPITLDNCRANGVDPTMLGLDGISTSYSVEVLRKGGQQVQLNIDPETSTSYTYGVIFDQFFWDDFTLRAGVTYYDIEVEDSIALLGTGYIVNDCYVESPNNSSAFCHLVKRDADGLIDIVDSSYVNINTITSRGIDYNLFYQRNFIIADRNLDLQVDVRMTRLLENLFIFLDSEEDDAGTTIAPEWEGTLLVNARYNDFRFNWRANYISGETEEPFDLDNYVPCSTLDVLCAPKVDTSYYWTHTASVTWTPRDWFITVGVVNMFDKDPPLIDTAAPETQLNNIPLGAGYDILGRRVFASVSKQL